MKRVLHITNWYPNEWDSLEGIFIYEQFKIFSNVTNSHIINIQVRDYNKLFKFKYIKYSKNQEAYYIFTKIKTHKIIEIITTFLLIFVLFKSKYKKFDILHFHIAYPILSYYHIWKKFIKSRIIISEHYSAYHFNFYMPKDTKKLDGIKRIFRQDIPLISVSKALIDDIKNFSNSNFKSIVIPNIIDTDYFFIKDKVSNSVVRFFSVNNWRDIKNPFDMLDGFLELYRMNIDFILTIGGYGELYKDIEEFIVNNNISNKIKLLPKLNKEEIANQLALADFYITSSKYETFSVVSAQSLVCGVPLISPPIPAILEYTDDKSHIKVYESWSKSLKYAIDNIDTFNREYISTMANSYLSHKNIEKKYIEFLDEI